MIKNFRQCSCKLNSGLALVSMILVAALWTGCKQQPTELLGKSRLADSEVIHPEWSRNANIYEVNIRQYTPEGTFLALTRHLPRLKEMGVDILWLMPVNPIGELNRKGTLGSYYAIKDYMAVNPEYGTLDDLRLLVNRAHELGMKVILDWVANHTAWDNVLTVDHPEWYKRDTAGNPVSPYDWTDVLQLDYDQKELHDYMISAMKYWVTEADVDGFRCDVASMVPTEFWNRARRELDQVKPVFMLAESEKPELLVSAFDMDYGWEFHHIMNQVAQGKMNVRNMIGYLRKTDTLYPGNSFRMYFTSNHDENSWQGTEFERMGDAAPLMAVLSATVPGMPLIYTGQEACLDKRLKFFEKDTIDWDRNPEYAEFYKILLALKKRNQALWNGNEGGLMELLPVAADSVVMVFTRQKENDRVLCIFNMSAEKQEINMKNFAYPGNYTEVFTGDEVTLKKRILFKLEPWDYRIFELSRQE
ncbi:MAG: alpha-amylase family glycosyl hydrolase [Bacteroidales bacterium]|nr:alpha-glucosidase C-terminal domain-containing protein [Lentimicrobiaceae bacterium]MDD5696000.1 alpha-amylase family glycosyl hydrolase [Bacteroidales bacterium]